MTGNELKERAKDYSERHQFWTGLSISQFGNSVNIFTTIGIALIGFLVVKYFDPKFICNLHHCQLAIYKITIVIVFLSMLAGVLSILCRLYDLRLTRHLLSITRHVLNIKKKVTVDEINEWLEVREKPDINNWVFFKELIKIFFCKIIFIENEEEFENLNQVKEDFKWMKRLSIKFGKVSWALHKFQILSFFIAAVIFVGFLISMKY